MCYYVTYNNTFMLFIVTNQLITNTNVQGTSVPINIIIITLGYNWTFYNLIAPSE